ncbi:cupin domain-containing protein [Clostridium celatum]|uniref:Cupin domain protein n=1 Tax=Clostridium celatum DSM 1785 TaxID=545697 RepID=L1QHW2_9CLOT|nr:cupin domain-containing protein [Clostridium celatum]EKY27521.1 cupin domain protein [Clostridium celatum DSM 1785]MCE9655571.1 cupin domain-containing protein [Clostridium celatum]MDU2265957.1 cupin domain-containing protein [Clostridium celatum]MDU3723566.1 cupin domain-containing protein [Clostridium celatum]MDU6296205.1 cupin domain-containing protein [Clostridium celatum]
MNLNNNDIIKVANIDNIDEGKEIIAMNKKFKTICFVFDVGKGLPNHTHNGYASVLVYDGSVSLEFVNGEKYELNKGDFMPFDARIEHNVIARSKSKVLVTISESLAE